MSLNVGPHYRTFLYEETINAGDARVIVHRGGTRSSKTHSLAQVCCDILEREPDKLIGIFRKTFPALRISVMADIITMLKARGTYSYMKHNLSDSTIKNPANQSSILFSSVDDPQKLRGPEWNYVWLNEANEFDYETYQHFSFRMSRKSLDGKKNMIFLDFNPDDPDIWIKTKLEDLGRCKTIVSTYKDNPFLDDVDRAKIEYLEETDANFWNVFGLGQYGTRNKGLIFTNWKHGLVEQVSGDLTEEIFGLDFGFNNATAIIGVQHDWGDNIFLREVLYQSGLTNSDLITLLTELNIPKRAHIYADAAEPARIEEIKRAGWLNCTSASKSVKPGIDFMKRFTLTLVGDAVNLERELKRYKWKEGRNEVLQDEPVKFDDHAIDAARYAIFTHGSTYWSGKQTIILPSAAAAKGATGTRRRDDNLFKGYY